MENLFNRVEVKLNLMEEKTPVMSPKLSVRETKLIDVGNKLSRSGNKFLDSVPYIIPAHKYKNSQTQQPNALTSRNLVFVS